MGRCRVPSQRALPHQADPHPHQQQGDRLPTASGPARDAATAPRASSSASPAAESSQARRSPAFRDGSSQGPTVRGDNRARADVPGHPADRDDQLGGSALGSHRVIKDRPIQGPANDAAQHTGLGATAMTTAMTTAVTTLMNRCGRSETASRHCQ
jgi:hypothetical protein